MAARDYLLADLANPPTLARIAAETGLSAMPVSYTHLDVYKRQHRGGKEQILKMLEYLSNKFTVDDIKFHPVPYQIYKSLISFNFLYEQYFSKSIRKTETEKIYHQAQKWY